MTNKNIATIILAAGQGTRMKSAMHKVLHPIGGKPMVDYLIDSAAPLNPARTIVVVGAEREQVEAHIGDRGECVLQAEQKGTGHAVMVTKNALCGNSTDFDGDVIVLFGDVPFISTDIMQSMFASRGEASLVVLGFEAADPGAYGRLVLDENGSLERIVEFKDATEDERTITLCNSGIMVIDGKELFGWLNQLSSDNAAGEYYLTDLVEIANKAGHTVAVATALEDDVMGVNSRADLAAAEAAFQARACHAAMAGGATLIDPATTYFSHDTKLGSDVTIEPGVYFGPGVTVEDNVTIKAYSHIEGATVRRGAIIGPFARLRPAADIGEGAKVGNFVEIKKATLDTGAKVNHLSYIGDASVGAAANIGAGTITCNYDGFLKHQTNIGAGAFIGSNTALVAPVSVGDGAMVGAGSVITKSVEDDGMALTRAQQKQVAGYAAKFRSKQAAKKEALKKDKK